MLKELKIEWGLTSEQFDNESEDEILSIIALRQAKSEGERMYNEKNKK